jgi:hypothetical protein
MKIKELLNEAGPEWIKHPTAKGVMIKNPKWEPPAKPAREKSGLDRSGAMKKRHEDAHSKLWQLHQIIFNAVGNTFPDGDPADWIVPKARKLYGLDDWADPWKYINKAVQEFEGYKDLGQWLASMWDDSQKDAMYDAENGHDNGEGIFWNRDKNGKPQPEDNPWGTPGKKMKKKSQKLPSSLLWKPATGKPHIFSDPK